MFLTIFYENRDIYELLMGIQVSLSHKKECWEDKIEKFFANNDFDTLTLPESQAY